MASSVNGLRQYVEARDDLDDFGLCTKDAVAIRSYDILMSVGIMVSDEDGEPLFDAEALRAEVRTQRAKYKTADGRWNLPRAAAKPFGKPERLDEKIEEAYQAAATFAEEVLAKLPASMDAAAEIGAGKVQIRCRLDQYMSFRVLTVPPPWAAEDAATLIKIGALGWPDEHRETGKRIRDRFDERGIVYSYGK